MGDLPMPGGWTLSMMWMRMPGQTWPGAAAMFLAMWTTMTAVMMLPSMAPTLWRYHREAGRAAATSPAWLTAAMSTGYFIVWTVAGVATFLLGATLAASAVHHAVVARVMPIAAGAVVLLAGALQCSEWKARHLGSCRAWRSPVGASPASTIAAWRHGLRLGVHCGCSCAPLMMVGLVLGVMNATVMSILIVAVTAERLAPEGERIAHVSGKVAMGVGVLLMVRALSP